LMLYMLGSQGGPGYAAIHNVAHCIAMVGSRNPTPQGETNAREFARALAGSGLCVVSGLALGIDAAAHDGALLAGACTVAVVGTGLDRVYPKGNLALAHRIAQQGLIVSEFPLGTPPLTANFPRRNRIISGLSKGVLVVEAALKSGSLITARLAAEQGKDVFAIPGSIHSPQSRGCHALIKQGAKLVETVEDVLDEMKPPASRHDDNAAPDRSSPTPGGQTGPTTPALQPDALLVALGFDVTTLDALQARTGLPTAELQARLLELELDGHLSRLPGGKFQRLASA
jgi:DNA processing protein